MPKILIIEDSVLMRSISREHLENSGFTVEDFLPESVPELVNCLKRSQPDLVLSDFNMPRVDGAEVARTVRMISPKIPVIILTSNRDATRDAQLKIVGVRKILHKPIKGEDLVAAVRDVVPEDPTGGHTKKPA